MQRNLLALTAAVLVVQTLCGCGSSSDGGSGGSSSSNGGNATAGAAANAGKGGASGSAAGSGGNAAGSSGTAGATACLTGLDCGDPTTQVCDAKTGQCVSGQCSSNAADCGTGKLCVQQVNAVSVGACYDDCVPYVTPCSDASNECVPIFLDDSQGVCLPRGKAVDGATCQTSQISTGCSAGDLCVRESGGPICRKQCEYFAAAPACAAGNRCSMGDICTPGTFDPAKLGELCAPDAPVGSDCGDDGHALRGICGNRGAGLSCYPICRIDGQDCAANSTCTPVFSAIPELGVCFESSACTTGSLDATSCEACANAALATGGCCEKQQLACDNQPDCVDLLKCLEACDTDACQTACEDQYGLLGGNALNALLGCVYGTSNGRFLGACANVCR